MNREELMLKLFNDRKLADVTFVIDEEEIPVHKAILAGQSSYFHTMLFGNTNEANATRITLNERPLKQFKEVIRFCYLKKVQMAEWNVEDVCKLLNLAHEYNFDSLLKEIPEEMLEQSILNSVSLPIFHDLAVALDLKYMFNAIKRFVRSNNVEENEEFVGYSGDLVSFIFDAYEVKQTAIKALWKWKASHSDQDVKQVFKSIRWEGVSSDILAEVLRVMIPQTTLLNIAEPAQVVVTRNAAIHAHHVVDESDLSWRHLM